MRRYPVLRIQRRRNIENDNMARITLWWVILENRQEKFTTYVLHLRTNPFSRKRRTIGVILIARVSRDTFRDLARISSGDRGRIVDQRACRVPTNFSRASRT